MISGVSLIIAVLAAPSPPGSIAFVSGTNPENRCVCVVEAAGGSARQAADAGAIMFQNAMGLVCDLVQAIVEIPCHTRNGSFASQAFICADMILGGYYNAVHIDDTVDAVYSSGKMLPLELRCTSLGGMAVTPSALSMPRKR